MPLPSAIVLHQTGLARFVAGLFALLGLANGSPPERIGKELHRRLARTLRPAESAVRRLIVFLAAGIKIKPPLPRPMAADILRNIEGKDTRKARMSFKLFDPRPRLLRPQRRRDAPRAQPRISFFGDNEVRTLSFGASPQPASDGLAPAASLIRRLQALRAALENLPRQARRLKRALARRAQSERLKLRGPLRPGRPPGFRKRAIGEIDAILHQCDWLASKTLPDTS